MKIIEKDYYKIWLENDIVYSEYSPNCIMTLELAKEGVSDRLMLSGGVSRPMIADVRNLKSVDDSARNFLASEMAVKYICVLAVVKETPIQNLFANYYLQFDKPAIPTRLFSNFDKALRWVELFKEKTLN